MKRRIQFTAVFWWLWALSSFAQVGPERMRIAPLDGDGNGLPISLTQPDQQFRAFLAFFPGAGLAGGEQDVTGQVTWQVSPASVASMGPGGLIHALSVGTATVTAVSGP